MTAASTTVTDKGHAPRVHWAWVVLGSSFVTLFVTYSIRIGAYSVLLPEMIKDLQITNTQGGMIKSAFFMVYLILAPLVGWLSDRIGGRKVISFFCLFLGGGTFRWSFGLGALASLVSAVLIGFAGKPKEFEKQRD